MEHSLWEVDVGVKLQKWSPRCRQKLASLVFVVTPHECKLMKNSRNFFVSYMTSVCAFPNGLWSRSLVSNLFQKGNGECLTFMMRFRRRYEWSSPVEFLKVPCLDPELFSILAWGELQWWTPPVCCLTVYKSDASFYWERLETSEQNREQCRKI